MDDVYENTEAYNANNERKILIDFDYMIADVLSNKKLNLIVTELFIMGKKLNFFCFYHTILFYCTKKYYTKFYTILLRKFQINESFKKSHLIIHQILALKTLNLCKKCT